MPPAPFHNGAAWGSARYFLPWPFGARPHALSCPAPSVPGFSMPGLSSWSPPIHEAVIQSCRLYDEISFFFSTCREGGPSLQFASPSGIRTQASPVANGRVESRESPLRAGPSRPTPHIRGTHLAKALESKTAHWPYPMYAGLSFTFAESGAKPVWTTRSCPPSSHRI